MKKVSKLSRIQGGFIGAFIFIFQFIVSGELACLSYILLFLFVNYYYLCML